MKCSGIPGEDLAALRWPSMLGESAMVEPAKAEVANPLAPKPPHRPAHAKAVIHLFMHGGVSHVDTFDPKPELAKRDGQTISAEMAKGLKTNRIDFARAPMRGSPWKFQRHGESGMEISELFPGIASKADEIALIRSCYGDAFDHAPGDVSPQFRFSVSWPALPRLMGNLRAGLGESEPACIRGDVGWCDEVRAQRL